MLPDVETENVIVQYLGPEKQRYVYRVVVSGLGCILRLGYRVDTGQLPHHFFVEAVETGRMSGPEHNIFMRAPVEMFLADDPMDRRFECPEFAGYTVIATRSGKIIRLTSDSEPDPGGPRESLSIDDDGGVIVTMKFAPPSGGIQTIRMSPDVFADLMTAGREACRALGIVAGGTS